jgi:hypothetical protein
VRAARVLQKSPPRQPVLALRASVALQAINAFLVPGDVGKVRKPSLRASISVCWIARRNRPCGCALAGHLGMAAGATADQDNSLTPRTRSTGESSRRRRGCRACAGKPSKARVSSPLLVSQEFQADPSTDPYDLCRSTGPQHQRRPADVHIKYAVHTHDVTQEPTVLIDPRGCLGPHPRSARRGLDVSCGQQLWVACASVQECPPS